MKFLPSPWLKALSVVAVGCSPSALAGFVTLSAGGDATTASIQPTVDIFRTNLGNPNNGNAVGPLLAGRREINWDGGGAATTDSGSPFFGFRNNRGAAFSTPGTGFVQATPAGLATRFSQPSYGTSFGAFSAQRLFTPVGSNSFDITFSVPGSDGTIPATVDGFGAVFSDVDLPGISRLQFFDFQGNELFNQTVPPAAVSNAGFSFLGAKANAGERIFKVVVTTGNGNLLLGGLDGGGLDVVTVDDFLFSEPVPIPEPTTAIFGLGIMMACLSGRRRARR
jgi:hypothetical protein